MKNLIALLLIFISTNLFSQVEKPITKGNFLFGGSASGGYYSINFSSNSESYSESNSTKYLDASLNPSLGYFIFDGLAIGLSLNTSFIKGLEDYKRSSFEVGLGPYAKYYTSIGLFAGGTINYSFEKETSYNYTNNVYSVIPEIGYAYFLNSKIAFETSLNYSFSLSKYSSENPSQVATTKNNHVYFSFGFQIFL